MALPNFKLSNKQPLSVLAREQGIHDFHSLCQWVRLLPYRRISDAANPSLILTEEQGTCSSKHALLWQVALENGRQDIDLILGMFRMTALNTSNISKVLKGCKLDAIPEAHNYLAYKGKRYDFTKPGIDIAKFSADLMLELHLKQHQLGAWKTTFQKEFIGDWLVANPDIPYTAEEVWDIREACIHAIATAK